MVDTFFLNLDLSKLSRDEIVDWSIDGSGDSFNESADGSVDGPVGASDEIGELEDVDDIDGEN